MVSDRDFLPKYEPFANNRAHQSQSQWDRKFKNIVHLTLQNRQTNYNPLSLQNYRWPTNTNNYDIYNPVKFYTIDAVPYNTFRPPFA